LYLFLISSAQLFDILLRLLVAGVGDFCFLTMMVSQRMNAFLYQREKKKQRHSREQQQQQQQQRQRKERARERARGGKYPPRESLERV
jgi:flagellar biosynthesis component FlhA